MQSALSCMAAIAVLAMGAFGALIGYGSWGEVGLVAGLICGAILTMPLTWAIGVVIIAFGRLGRAQDRSLPSRAMGYALCAVIALAVVGIVRQLGI